jgi:hypothetical protein
VELEQEQEHKDMGMSEDVDNRGMSVEFYLARPME